MTNHPNLTSLQTLVASNQRDANERMATADANFLKFQKEMTQAAAQAATDRIADQKLAATTAAVRAWAWRVFVGACTGSASQTRPLQHGRGGSAHDKEEEEEEGGSAGENEEDLDAPPGFELPKPRRVGFQFGVPPPPRAKRKKRNGQKTTHWPAFRVTSPAHEALTRP